MNCPEVRAALPEFIYGGLAPEARVQVEGHLKGCPKCRREAEALSRVRRLLTEIPAPQVRVDVATVYREAAERQARRLRRWRRLALAACAAALLVVTAAALSRLEIRVGSTELVVRWGNPLTLPAPPPAPQPPQAAPPPAPPVVDSREIDSIQERLSLLSELTQALADDGRDRDYKRDQEIARMRDQLRQWQGQSAERLRAMEKDFDALYAAQFPDRKGVNP